MMAQILLEYSSDGLPPSEVDRTVRGMGLARDGAFFLLQASSEEEMRDKLDRLHDALRGSGARYSIASEEAGASDEQAIVDQGGTMSDEDLEGRVEEVTSLLRRGDREFSEILEAMDIGEVELTAVLQAMADRGLVIPHLGDGGLSYRHAGPMLRSMAR